MLVTKLRIDGQVFFLPTTTDVEALKADIVAASKDGAAFVEFDTHGHGRVSVLVTPTVPARFEIVDREDDEVAEWTDQPSFDFDAESF